MTPPAASSAARSVAPRSATPAGAPRRAQPKRPPLRVAPEPNRFVVPFRGLRPGRVGTIAGIALFVSMFLLAAFQTVIIKSQADIDATTHEITEQETLHRQLDYQLADLNSPKRVADAAARLGLITPGTVTYLQPDATDSVNASLAPTSADGDAAASESGAGPAGPTAP
jgi:hypothetical protein